MFHLLWIDFPLHPHLWFMVSFWWNKRNTFTISSVLILTILCIESCHEKPWTAARWHCYCFYCFSWHSFCYAKIALPLFPQIDAQITFRGNYLWCFVKSSLNHCFLRKVVCFLGTAFLLCTQGRTFYYCVCKHDEQQ